MADTFYRVHWSDCPEFSADNAWSTLWGADRDDARTGYSCTWDAEDLREYFAEHGEPDDDEIVILFEGRHVGQGFDGEPLAIPTRVVRTMTWAEFEKSL
mgnify:CR=1 FL=1